MYSIRPSRQVNLMVSKVTAVDVPPKDLVTYARETQTPKELLEREGKFLCYLIFVFVLDPCRPLILLVIRLIFYVSPFINFS